jgi:biotin operon repressor
MRGQKLQTSEVERIREALIDGHTVSEVARRLGMSRNTVNNIAVKMRAEGVRVMRAPQGRKPQVAA